MIDCINQFLDLFINLAVSLGIIFLVFFYIKLKIVDDKIEKKYKEFEASRDTIRANSVGRGITISVVDLQIASQKRILDEYVAPYQRERERIVSKIPFIK